MSIANNSCKIWILTIITAMRQPRHTWKSLKKRVRWHVLAILTTYLETRLKPWFPFTANSTVTPPPKKKTKTKKLSDYVIEQSSFPLVILFWLVIGFQSLVYCLKDHRTCLGRFFKEDCKGGFPVMAETTRKLAASTR